MKLPQFVPLLLCLAVAGCGLPRGAGFQSEVLAASNADTRAEGEEAVYDFAVFDVTRETLDVLQSWPKNGGKTYPWISRQEQPASLIIAPGDQVSLTIWDAEEHSLLAGAGQRATPLQQVEVSTTGRIFVPYIGELRVSGMSPDTARNRIEEELIRTIPSAQVQLVVEPGGAAALAAAPAGKVELDERRVIMLTGGNADPAPFAATMV